MQKNPSMKSALKQLNKTESKKMVTSPSVTINAPSTGKTNTDSKSKKINACQSTRVIANNHSPSMKIIKGNKAQSCINLASNDKTLTKSFSNSLKPFPTIDPEFYNEGSNYFWQKEIKKISSEKSIFGKNKSKNNSLSESHSKLFYSSSIFEKKEKIPLSIETTQKKAMTRYAPKTVQINLQAQARQRDYHNNVNVTNPSKSKNDEDLNPSRKRLISPMHLKLYESSMQKDYTFSKAKVPSSHPSYDKDMVKKQKIAPDSKKKLEILKTTYNFLKNYY